MATISLQVPRLLQRHCNDRDSIELEATNVESALKKVKASYPDLYINICNEKDVVRQHINLFVNNDLVDKNSLAKTILKTGDDLLVFTAVSGG